MTYISCHAKNGQLASKFSVQSLLITSPPVDLNLELRLKNSTKALSYCTCQYHNSRLRLPWCTRGMKMSALVHAHPRVQACWSFSWPGDNGLFFLYISDTLHIVPLIRGNWNRGKLEMITSYMFLTTPYLLFTHVIPFFFFYA